MGCNDVFLGEWLPTFRRVAVPSSSRFQTFEKTKQPLTVGHPDMSDLAKCHKMPLK